VNTLLTAGLLAASTASSPASAASHRPFSFDPAVTLPGAVPALLIIPLVGLLFILAGVRTRRAAANLGLATVIFTLLDALLVVWARFRAGSAYTVAYQWINVPVSFSGAQQFQGFGVDLSFRLDHYALVALVVLLLVFAACLSWHRVAGRNEPGQIRYQVIGLGLLLSAVGVVVSGDMVEQLAFWMVGGAASYALLSHRWGTDAFARASRVALALPFAGDVALYCGVAVLYSRFGLTDMTRIRPLLHSSPGVGLKSLTVAALLIFGAVAVRAAIWPFTAWQSGTLDQPPSLVALVAGVWPLLAGMVMLRYLPLLGLGGAGPQASRIAAYTLAVAAVVGPLLSLLTVDLRRALLLASSGAVALALLGLLYRDAPIASAAFTGLLAVAAGRAGMLLSAGTFVAALRTVDLRLTGGGWERLRVTTVGLLVACAAVGFGVCAAAAARASSLAWVAFAGGLVLVAAACFRVVFVVGFGELVRRRAFEPSRVREAPPPVAGAGLTAALVGALATVLTFIPGWAGFLEAGRRTLSVGTDVLWLAWPVLGLALAAGAVLTRSQVAVTLLGRLGESYLVAWGMAGALYARFVSRPGLQIVRGVESVGVPAAESGVARALVSVGVLAGRSLPWVTSLLALAAALAIAFGLLSPGVRR
jgi:formate hydrogenlyase subunit 3/multisubunit Na+/H+ antiporter MnhD subunit